MMGFGGRLIKAEASVGILHLLSRFSSAWRADPGILFASRSPVDRVHHTRTLAAFTAQCDRNQSPVTFVRGKGNERCFASLTSACLLG
jgi:hypothetical protein